MDLPNDVVMEILSWLPLEKGAKTRALSKFHAKVSHQSYYKELLAQRQRGPILDGFLFQSFRKTRNILCFASPRPIPVSTPLDFSLSFLPGCNPRILAVAPNGLVLCESRHVARPRQQFYVVCKPSTKQWKGLPLPRIRFETKNTAMFVVRSNPLHFKIFRMSDNPRPKHPPRFSFAMCELFDSRTWRWRRLGDIPRDCSSSHVSSHCRAVMASGSAHWKFIDGDSVFAFHFETETWSTIQMPAGFTRWRTELVEYEGKLGLMREAAESTELWVMENYSGRVWTKRIRLVGSMPMAFYGSDVSATWDFCKVKFCNLEMGGCCRYGEMEGITCYSWPMIFPFLSDFEPWNFDAPIRTLKPRTMAKILRKRLNNVAIFVSFCFFFARYYNYFFSAFLLGVLHSAALHNF